MASKFETGELRKTQIEDCCKKPLLIGIRGEDLNQYAIRPSVRHTNGAREALKAQQF